VGSAIYSGGEQLLITAWQRDEAQNLSGFTQGNLISAQVYRQSNGVATKHLLKKFSGAKPYFGEGYFASVVLEVIPSIEEPFNFDVLPNPFKDVTAVVVELFRDEMVKVNIYDNTGRLVKTLANDQLPADTYRLSWNGTDHSGKKLNPGVYFIIAETTNAVITEKVIILQ
jgi:hypothetical protein